MSNKCYPSSGSALGQTEEQRALGLAIYIVSWAVFLLSLFVFLWGKYKRKLAWLRRRHTILVLAIFFGCVIQLHMDTLEMIITSSNYNCTVKLFLGVLVVPLLACGIAGRLVTFYFRSRYEQLAMRDRAPLSPPPASSSQQPQQQHQLSSDSERWAATSDAAGSGGEGGGADDVLITAKHAVFALALGGKELFFHRTSHSLDLAALRFLQSGNVTMIFFVGVFLLPALAFAVVLTIANRANGLVECTGCLRTVEVGLFIALQAGVTMFFIMGGLYRSHTFPDVFGILWETVWSLVWSAIVLAGFVLGAFFQDPSTMAGGGGAWDYAVLVDVGLMGVIFCQSALQVLLGLRADADDQQGTTSITAAAAASTTAAKSLILGPFRRQRALTTRIENLEANGEGEGELDAEIQADADMFDHLRLDQVLHHSDMSRLFEDHLAKEFAVESLYFLRDARRWTAEYAQVSAQTRTTRAKKLVNVYIRPSGVLAINLPHSLSKRVLEIIDAQPPPEDVSVDLFAKSIREIEALLERGAIPRFSRKLAYDKKSRQVSFRLS